MNNIYIKDTVWATQIAPLTKYVCIKFAATPMYVYMSN
jgi:hypothetical protein